MRNITIRPSWVFSDESGREVDSRLFDLLRAVRDTGKLTQAAKTTGLSYRHAWDLISRWTDFFGCPLVESVRGRGATVTPFGSKFIWAEERVRAQLSPQLDNFASEIRLGLQQALADVHPVLRVQASHGFAVAKLPELMTQSGIRLDLQYHGSLESLASLHRGACELAGFHVPDGDVAERVAAQYLKWLRPRAHRLIYLARRTQGLMVPRGNPRNVAEVQDLVRPELCFVNRQRASGTRVLLDQLLKDRVIDAGTIRGYENAEFTHAAVAAHVASGMADVGFGLEAAARKFDLDFIPVITERYLLATRADSLEKRPVATLIERIGSREFADLIRPLPGYDASGAGDVLTVMDVLPWAECGRRP